MNKSADGERGQMFISPPSLATPTDSLWMAGGAGEGGRREGIRRRHRTKFKMTAYIRMDF